MQLRGSARLLGWSAARRALPGAGLSLQRRRCHAPLPAVRGSSAAPPPSPADVHAVVLRAADGAQAARLLRGAIALRCVPAPETYRAVLAATVRAPPAASASPGGGGGCAAAVRLTRELATSAASLSALYAALADAVLEAGGGPADLAVLAAGAAEDGVLLRTETRAALWPSLPAGRGEAAALAARVFGPALAALRRRPGATLPPALLGAAELEAAAAALAADGDWATALRLLEVADGARAVTEAAARHVVAACVAGGPAVPRRWAAGVLRQRLQHLPGDACEAVLRPLGPRASARGDPRALARLAGRLHDMVAARPGLSSAEAAREADVDAATAEDALRLLAGPAYIGNGSLAPDARRRWLDVGLLLLPLAAAGERAAEGAACLLVRPHDPVSAPDSKGGAQTRPAWEYVAAVVADMSPPLPPAAALRTLAELLDCSLAAAGRFPGDAAALGGAARARHTLVGAAIPHLRRHPLSRAAAEAGRVFCRALASTSAAGGLSLLRAEAAAATGNSGSGDGRTCLAALLAGLAGSADLGPVAVAGACEALAPRTPTHLQYWSGNEAAAAVANALLAAYAAAAPTLAGLSETEAAWVEATLGGSATDAEAAVRVYERRRQVRPAASSSLPLLRRLAAPVLRRRGQHARLHALLERERAAPAPPELAAELLANACDALQAAVGSGSVAAAPAEGRWRWAQEVARLAVGPQESPAAPPRTEDRARAARLLVDAALSFVSDAAAGAADAPARAATLANAVEQLHGQPGALDYSSGSDSTQTGVAAAALAAYAAAMAGRAPPASAAATDENSAERWVCDGMAALGAHHAGRADAAATLARLSASARAFGQWGTAAAEDDAGPAMGVYGLPRLWSALRPLLRTVPRLLSVSAASLGADDRAVLHHARAALAAAVALADAPALAEWGRLLRSVAAGTLPVADERTERAAWVSLCAAALDVTRPSADASAAATAVAAAHAAAARALALAEARWATGTVTSASAWQRAARAVTAETEAGEAGGGDEVLCAVAARLSECGEHGEALRLLQRCRRPPRAAVLSCVLRLTAAETGVGAAGGSAPSLDALPGAGASPAPLRARLEALVAARRWREAYALLYAVCARGFGGHAPWWSTAEAGACADTTLVTAVVACVAECAPPETAWRCWGALARVLPAVPAEAATVAVEAVARGGSPLRALQAAATCGRGGPPERVLWALARSIAGARRLSRAERRECRGRLRALRDAAAENAIAAAVEAALGLDGASSLATADAAASHRHHGAELSRDEVSALAGEEGLALRVLFSSPRQLGELAGGHLRGRLGPAGLLSAVRLHSAELRRAVAAAPPGPLSPAEAALADWLAGNHRVRCGLLRVCAAVGERRAAAEAHRTLFRGLCRPAVSRRAWAAAQEWVRARAAARWPAVAEAEVVRGVLRDGGRLPARLRSAPAATRDDIAAYWSVYHDALLPQLRVGGAALCAVAEHVPHAEAARALPAAAKDAELWELAWHVRLAHLSGADSTAADGGAAPSADVVRAVLSLARPALRKLHAELTSSAASRAVYLAAAADNSPPSGGEPRVFASAGAADAPTRVALAAPLLRRALRAHPPYPHARALHLAALQILRTAAAHDAADSGATHHRPPPPPEALARMVGLPPSAAAAAATPAAVAASAGRFECGDACLTALLGLLAERGGGAGDAAQAEAASAAVVERVRALLAVPPPLPAELEEVLRAAPGGEAAAEALVSPAAHAELVRHRASAVLRAVEALEGGGAVPAGALRPQHREVLRRLTGPREPSAVRAQYAAERAASAAKKSKKPKNSKNSKKSHK